jgi:hypothetical protein
MVQKKKSLRPYKKEKILKGAVITAAAVGTGVAAIYGLKKLKTHLASKKKPVIGPSPQIQTVIQMEDMNEINKEQERLQQERIQREQEEERKRILEYQKSEEYKTLQRDKETMKMFKVVLNKLKIASNEYNEASFCYHYEKYLRFINKACEYAYNERRPICIKKLLSSADLHDRIMDLKRRKCGQ